MSCGNCGDWCTGCNVHDHGTEEGKGLACREYRTQDGRLVGECLGWLWTCIECGWTNVRDVETCQRCFLHNSA